MRFKWNEEEVWLSYLTSNATVPPIVVGGPYP